ncbi:MAG: RidA family protein [Rhodospirillaceae bacterium]|jgi:enamine deaminase RidA (YjgF/YER057c/UK114 family)|nr:RidA family protein [Rhodospirillaceae bacterium]MBT5675250.1 RidA family protein [Rhodospirillaceae bacterium]
MPKVYNPSAIAGPFGHYDHGVEAALPGRLLCISGQTGVAANDSVPEDIAAQTELVWQNICAVLADAGMSPGDIVKTNSYVMDRDHIPVLAKMRKRFLGADHKAASTTLLVAGLVRPEWLVEIDAVAIKR